MAFPKSWFLRALAIITFMGALVTIALMGALAVITLVHLVSPCYNESMRKNLERAESFIYKMSRASRYAFILSGAVFIGLYLFASQSAQSAFWPAMFAVSVLLVLEAVVLLLVVSLLQKYR